MSYICQISSSMVWYMKWFDVKIISVRPTSPKIWAIALFLPSLIIWNHWLDQKFTLTKVYIYGCQKGWQLKAKAMVTILFWSDSVFGLSFIDGKSAIACIFGLVGQTEIILTSNHFIYQTPKIFFSACSALLSLLSFGILSGFWPL